MSGVQTHKSRQLLLNMQVPVFKITLLSRSPAPVSHAISHRRAADGDSNVIHTWQLAAWPLRGGASSRRARMCGTAAAATVRFDQSVWEVGDSR